MTLDMSAYSPGPSVLPRNQLIAFFESDAGKRTVRIPVVFHLSDGDVDEVFIGVSDDIEPAHKVLLEPDDTALGIGLEDRLESMFGDQPIGHAWLVGKWGALMEIPGFGPPAGIYPFTVHDLEERTDGPTRNDEAHIWV